MDEFAGLLAQYPDATILAGGTDVGLWVTKQHRELDTVIYTGRVAEFGVIEYSPSHLEIGAAVPLNEAMANIVDLFPGFEEMFRRFASPPIRNAATLGGNIANGSPIGDSMPALMAAGTSLVLRRGRSEREIPLEAFYVDYMVKDLRETEFLAKIRIPRPPQRAEVGCHKLSKRFDQDISGVCNAYYLELDGGTVAEFRMACGGMAEIVKRASNCEQAISGQPWNEETVRQGADALALDYEPISDMRASREYRLRAARNLLRRFFLETRGELDTSVYAYGR